MRQYTRQINDLGDPASVGIEFGFNFIYEVRHTCILRRSHFSDVNLCPAFPNISRRVRNR